MSIFPATRDNRSPVRRYLGQNWPVILILAAALALRLYVLYTQGNYMFLGTDDDNYRESAEILLHKGVLTYAGWREPTVFIMPGYPILLAGIFAVMGSTSWLAVRLFQVIVSIVALWFGIRLATHLGGRRVGIVAGILLAVYPPNLTTPCFLLTEGIFTCLLLASLFCFIKAEETRRYMWFVVTGVVLGLSDYFRPTSGLLPVVFGVYLVFRGYPLKRAVLGIGVMGTVMVVCLSPWIIRNYSIYREFIPSTVSGGNPFLRGTYIDGKITEKFPWVKGERILSDRAQMEYGKKRLVEGFRTNFRAYLYWYTVGKFTDYWGGPFYYKELTYLPVSWVNLFHRIVLVIGSGGLLLGVWRRRPLALLFLLVCAYFTLMHLLYLTGPRYSYPVMQLIIILAAYLLAGPRLYGGKHA